MRRALLMTSAGAAALVALLPGAGLPQEAAPGLDDNGSLVYTFGFSNEFRASDNLQLAVNSPGNAYYSETRLSFGIEAETRSQSLFFEIGNRFRVGTGKGSPDNQYLLPDLDLAYTRESRNSELSVDASVITRDMAIDALPLDIVDPSELLTDEGFELREELSVDLQTGLNAPVGADFGVFVNNLHYIDTTDPDLYNRITYGGNAAMVFRPDTVTAIRLGYEVSQYEAEDSLRRERLTQSVNLSAERDLNALTAINGRFGYKTVDETYRATDTDGDDNSGFVVAVGLDRDLPTGAVATELSHDVTGAGGRSDFSVTREIALPAGALSLTAGVTKPESIDLQPIGGIRYSHELNRQRIVLDANTRIIVSDDDTVQRASRIGLSYDILVNEENMFGVSFDYARTDDAGAAGDVNAVERTTATASYTHSLTEDWSLSTGYTHRFRDQEGTGSANASEIFVSLGRNFSWRP